MVKIHSVTVYLAGKVAKGAEIGVAPDWREEYAQSISQVGPFKFLSPDDPTLDENFPELVFGHDCYQVRECDVLVVNAAAKLGVGTAQEMLIAKYFGKRVLVVLPRDTHHRRTNLRMHDHVVSDWIHPFIACTSDAIVASLDELCVYLKQNWDDIEARPSRTLAVIDSAIDTYLKSNHALQVQ